MNINPKWFRRKSPEEIALEKTIAHWLRYFDKDLIHVVLHSLLLEIIETDLALVALEISDAEGETNDEYQ